MSQAQATSTAHQQDFGRGTWTPPAGWLTRVAARLIDDLVQVVGTLPYVVGLVMLLGLQSSGATIYQSVDPARQTDHVTVIAGLGLMGLGGILSLVIWIWNRVVHQGRTGQTLGKAVMKIVLVSSTTGKPVGPASALAREIAHLVDGVLYIGYLWPLWDPRKQTLADKIVGTMVTQEVRPAQCDEATWAQRALG
ncbi:RDD family protein [Pedococcus sp. P5_B7]